MQPIEFLQRQFADIQHGGWPVFRNKAVTLLSLLLALPAVLLVRLLRPWVVVRFGQLMSERIGHFAGNTEIYLCERDAGMHDRRFFDVFYYASPVCNRQLKKMWDRTLCVFNFARYLDKLCRRLPGGEEHVIMWRPGHDRDVHGLLARTKPHLSFTREEEQLGRAGLRAMGMPDDAPFVCFQSRDSAYLEAAFPDRDWNYHDYRDSKIHNYISAAEELTRRGCFAIRMGSVVREALTCDNPMIIDYSTKYRTEFLDIYLGAKCRFFFSGDTGLWAIPDIFRRSIAFVNLVPLQFVNGWDPHHLFIPKKLWLREEGRFLTFRERIEGEIGRFIRTDQYEQRGIEVIENTPEEITALVIEMDERLKGTWRTTAEDQELQQRFWTLFKPSELNKVFVARIGAEFLRQNRALLE